MPNPILPSSALSPQTMVIQIPQQHPCYAAHFPDAAVVPGALLLFWIEEKIKSVGYQLEGVANFKFLTPVLPGQQCSLQCQLKAGVSGEPTTKLSVQGFCNDELVFKGVLIVAAGVKE